MVLNPQNIAPGQALNQQPNEPTLKDLLDVFKKESSLKINCHHLATIKSFNALTQTAEATINYKKTFFKPSQPGSNSYSASLVDYPILLDCPVVVLGGGDGALTFPIESGDECIALFNDRDIDNWYSGATNDAPATNRLHSFSDAILLVGIRSMTNALPLYSSSKTELRTKDGVNKISLGSDDITIELGPGLTAAFTNDGKFSVTNTLGEYTDLIYTMLNALLTATAGGFPLVIPPDFATALTKFQSFKA